MNRTIEKDITKEENSKISEFIEEIENSLDDSKDKITIDESFYNEIYDDLELASKYKEILENIIKECMLEYSYDTEFLYVNHDKKSNKYYIDYYDGDVTKTKVTKQELQEANHKIGAFYVPILDGEFLEEVDYVKDSIKESIESKLEELEKNNKRGKKWKIRKKL